MDEANKKSSKSSPKSTRKKNKPPCPVKNTKNSAARDQRVKDCQQTHYRASQTFLDGQENPASDPRDLADKTAATAATWSYLATPDYGASSQKQTQNHEHTMIDETHTYELGRWAYETSRTNLTLAERLEKGKWEAEGVERL